MKLLDNVSQLFGDDLKKTIKQDAKIKIAASCFSIYAFEALKEELETIESFEFIFTSPTFVPEETLDKIKLERREFHISKAERERSFYGTEFEILLKNKLTQRAIAKECADWIRRKAKFRSNRSKAPMQQMASVETNDEVISYMPIQGFTAVDLGYSQGDAVSNLVNKIDEPAITKTYLNLFEQIWNDLKKGDAFKLSNTQVENVNSSAHSIVDYDLLGKISEGTKLTRKTIAEILTKIQPIIFGQFKENPEDFIKISSRLHL